MKYAGYLALPLLLSILTGCASLAACNEPICQIEKTVRVIYAFDSAHDHMRQAREIREAFPPPQRQ